MKLQSNYTLSMYVPTGYSYTSLHEKGNTMSVLRATTLKINQFSRYIINYVLPGGVVTHPPLKHNMKKKLKINEKMQMHLIDVQRSCTAC